MTRKYRKVWIEHYGDIPKDENGDTYDIHHIDRDRSNNAIENLMCVSRADHYQLHLDAGDWAMASVLALRLHLPNSSELSRAAGLQAVKNRSGIHAQSPEERKLLSSKGGRAIKGQKWYNNGLENMRSFNDPGDGWMAGKLSCGSGMKHGTKLGVFWNDGTMNKRSSTYPGKGWFRGKLLNEAQKKRRSEIGYMSAKKRWNCG